mmetsp:Transcript_29885/g.88735  ORF Transcript_29885/g.88735 Transcript_29885/m.88735 type:complete len:207 (+) Transcript_29885:78-698(+)
MNVLPSPRRGGRALPPLLRGGGRARRVLDGPLGLVQLGGVLPAAARSRGVRRVPPPVPREALRGRPRSRAPPVGRPASRPPPAPPPVRLEGVLHPASCGLGVLAWRGTRQRRRAAAVVVVVRHARPGAVVVHRLVVVFVVVVVALLLDALLLGKLPGELLRGLLPGDLRLSQLPGEFFRGLRTGGLICLLSGQLLRSLHPHKLLLG